MSQDPIRLKARRWPVRFIGLTGGIATGKSAAAACFARHGAQVLDADRVAREVVRPGQPAAAEIRRAFGAGVFAADGSLDRAALAAVVFADAAARRRLEAILHPRIEQQVLREAQRLLAAAADAIVVYDVPLLFETGIEDRFDLVVLVYAPRSEQLARIARRDGLSPEEAERRLSAQMDIEEKLQRADAVLHNTGTLAALDREVGQLLTRIRAERHRPGEENAKQFRA